MNTSFTPGQWFVDKRYPMSVMAPDGDSEPWLVCNVMEDCGGDQGEANARLIAAAPDMFVALQELLSMFKDHRDYGDDEATAVKLALAAINLATEQ